MVTTTSTGTGAVQTATKSLLTSLGTGSGVDTAGLVTSLVEAQFAAKTAQLTAKADKLTAQISGAATLKATMTGFATALDALAKGGTLRTQPVASNAAVLSASADSLGMSTNFAGTVRVDRLAAAQSTASAKAMANGAAASRTTVLGSGTFTLQLRAAAYTTDPDGTIRLAPPDPDAPAGASVTFQVNDASVDSIADAINKQAKSLGITASVVTGANGEAFLSIKGASGDANAFTLTTDGDAALDQFDIGTGSPVTAKAQNAQLTVDGVAVERASNTVADLFTGVKLELTATGTTRLSATRPTTALGQAVQDLVETYNQVLATVAEQTNSKTGTLFADPAAQALVRQLKAVTQATLGSSTAPGAPRTLAEIGVRTQRDGTLSIDTAMLTRVIADRPDAVEAMFAPTTLSSTGLPAQLQSIANAAANTITGLGGSTARYTKAQGTLAEAKDKLASASEAMTTRLTNQFAGMNARVSAYKATQSYLTNQIAAWNKSDG